MKKIVLALAIVVSSVGHTSAANFYWDSDLSDTVPGNNDAGTGANLGGAGIWDTVSTAWWDGTNPNTTWTDGNTAIFWGSGGGTVSIPTNATRAVTGLTFKSDTIVDGGATTTIGKLNFGATQVPLVADPNVTGILKTFNIGTGGYAISGGGTIAFAPFANVSSSTGAVSITGGSKLRLSRGGDIGGTGAASGNISIGDATTSGTLEVTDPTVGGTFLTTNRNIILGAGGGTLSVSGSAAAILQYAGIISGTGALHTTGPGEFRAVSGYTFTGGLFVDSGLYLISGAVPGTDTGFGPANNTATIAGGAAVGTGISITSAKRTWVLNGDVGFITPSATWTIGDTTGTSGSITGIGSVNLGKTGFANVGNATGGLTLVNANTYQGGTTAYVGTLRLTNTTGSAVGTGPVVITQNSNVLQGVLSVESNSTTQAPGGVTIQSGGTIRGNGSLPSSSALTINDGGRVLAGLGAANATLSLSSISFATSSSSTPGVILESTLGASIQSTNFSDQLTVTSPGGLSMTGGTVNLVPLAAAGNPAGRTYTLINYSGGFTGDPNNFAVNNGTGYDGTTISNDAANNRIVANIGTTVNDRTWVQETFSFVNWSAQSVDAGNWARFDGSNWITPAGQANGIGSFARIPTNSPVTSNPIPGQTIALSDFGKTVGHLIIDNPNSFTINGPGSAQSFNRLTLQAYSGNAEINVLQGNHTITPGQTNAAGGSIFLVSPTTINVGDSASLTMGPTANIGGMTKTGNGMLKIMGADWNNAGATNINAGTLQYSNDNLSGLSNTSIVTIAGSATMDMNSSTSVAVNDIIGALAGSGSLINHGSLTINGNNTSPQTFSGTIDNTNGSITATRTFTKNGTGTQIVSATIQSTSTANPDDARFTAGTVSAGTLLLNNTAGNSLIRSTDTVTVGTAATTAATLGGTGSVDGRVALAFAAAHLAPGAGAGNSTFTANTVTTVAGAQIDSLLSTSGNSDKLAVTNAAPFPTLAVGTIITANATSASVNVGSPVYTLVDTTADLSATGTNQFGSFVFNNATGYDATMQLSSDKTNIEVAVTGTTLQDKTWTNNANGNWSAATATQSFWTTPGQPNGPGTTARFGAAGAASGTRTVTISDTNKIAKTIEFNSTNAYTIAGTAPNGLIFDTYDGSNGAIVLTTGSHSITAPVTLNKTTDLSAPGGGTLTISTNWAGAGALNINSGTLKFGTSAAGLMDTGLVTIGASGTLDMATIGDQWGDLAGAGTLKLDAGTSSLRLAGAQTTTFSGTIVKTTGNGTININKTAGSLNLTGNSNVNTGTVSVNGGTLFVNNSNLAAPATGSGPVIVANAPIAGAAPTLGGTGSVGGLLTVNNGGTLAPGNNGVGILTANAGMTLALGSVLNFDLNTIATSDKIDVAAGTLTLNGGTVNLANVGSMTGGTYTLIDYVGSISGALTNLTLGTQPSGFTYALVNNLTTTSIDLQVTAPIGAGDYNGDGKVDAADYVLWRKFNINGPAGYLTWRANFGAGGPGSGSSLGGSPSVPEPTTMLLLAVGAAFSTLARRRRR